MITFDADFESANLDQVRLRANNTFDCFMRNDTNGNGNLQWFYFRMKNNNEFMDTVHINLVNFTKGNSLFHHVSIIALTNSVRRLLKLCLNLEACDRVWNHPSGRRKWIGI